MAPRRARRTRRRKVVRLLSRPMERRDGRRGKEGHRKPVGSRSDPRQWSFLWGHHAPARCERFTSLRCPRRVVSPPVLERDTESQHVLVVVRKSEVLKWHHEGHEGHEDGNSFGFLADSSSGEMAEEGRRDTENPLDRGAIHDNGRSCGAITLRRDANGSQVSGVPGALYPPPALERDAESQHDLVEDSKIVAPSCRPRSPEIG